MALSVAAGPHAANGAGTVTTAAFTPTDGSLVVACMCLQWGGDPPTVSDSLGGTWTSRAVSTGGTVARIYTRPVVTGASMTVSVEPAIGGGAAVGTYIVTDQDSSPIGDDGGGGQEANEITPTILTSTAAGSYGFVAAAETWDLGAAPTSSDLTYITDDVTMYLLHGYKDLGSAGAETANLNGYGSEPTQWYWAALEILAAPEASATSLPPHLPGPTWIWRIF